MYNSADENLSKLLDLVHRLTDLIAVMQQNQKNQAIEIVRLRRKIKKTSSRLIRNLPHE